MDKKTLQAKDQIDMTLSKLSKKAHAIADDISSGKLKKEHILERLKKTIKTTPNLFGIGVAFIPYVNNPQKLQLSPYYVNREDKWYPTQDLLQVFTIPITYFDIVKQREITIGMVFVDYLLSNIKELMSSLELGRTGFGFILSEEGVFIAHPIEDYVKNHETIFHLADLHHDNALQRLAEKVIDGESGVLDYIDKATGQSAWIFYQFIPSTHWSMAVLFYNDVLEHTFLRQQLIWICIAIIIFLVLLSMLIFRIDKGGTHDFWQVVIFSSLLLMAGIGYLWYLTQTAPFNEKHGTTMIVDETGLQKFLASHTKPKEHLFQVPTGIFVESVKFSEISNVTFSGYIWQKYTDNIHKDLSRGFIISEAESSEITEAYRLKKEQTEVIGWHFRATVRHQFYHARYPFDRRELSLQIAHKDFDKNVILTPDLEAYEITNPSVRPGIKHEVVLSGWRVLKSFFNYHNHHKEINLGIDNFIEHSRFSHLHFTLLLKREFLAPFITNVLPLVIVATILFSLQMWLGKTTTFIRSLIGLFFGILLAHIRLRGSIITPELIYLEFFFLVVYCGVLYTTFSFFLYRYEIDVGYYRDGLVTKLLFWPIILISCFIMTVIVFYD
ncbi:hypothetical protein [Candidatus Parabeggiatoa sp. HSG14]|uniref:hypothetical protein n=1 Tax=Candidatus Parabeggiatoa sp. HSG14 TaxID=3055593 RepID=UPI0025A7CDF5|nr:hypothetical protein [Thiotrichales bacterium HSG14]